MGDEITGELNNTAPVTQPGVNNQGATVESDNDLTDDVACGTGGVDVARFPETPPGIDDQKKAAEKRAASSPNGGDATAQTYRAEVPFSGSALQLGSASSAGGAGASITTGGNIFVGATGKLGMQSIGAFTGQTKATMGLYSKAGTAAHSQDKFEIYSGGGVAPGACGSGGPAGNGGVTKPAETAEKWTAGVCNVVGVVKAGNDIYNAVGTIGAQTERLKQIGDALTIAKGGVDALNKGAAIVMSVAGTDKKTSKSVGAWGDTVSGGLNVLGGLAKIKDDPAGALSSVLAGVGGISGAQGGTSVLNPDGPVPGSTGAASKVPGGGGGGGGGGHGGGGGSLDIEKRSAAKIHQCSNIKITGNAPEGVDWKVGGAYLVNSIAVVDFQTTNWGAFAAVMFKVRAVALIDVKCRKFEMKALSKGHVKTIHTTITASALSTLDGATTVTKTLTVKKHSTLHDGLHVEQNTVLKNDLLVRMDATEKDDAKFEKACKFKGEVTVKGSWTSKNSLKASTEGKFG